MSRNCLNLSFPHLNIERPRFVAVAAAAAAVAVAVAAAAAATTPASPPLSRCASSIYPVRVPGQLRDAVV
ncbi:uncharacterized protein LY79DRAFT_668871 [Colletotrichum navitas]|uniref:Uncharacterized protein n=1 Tax=Colletotrichum navitas TaxID=681940 RepID=A0AAD8Q187_9PEZI|nr:uncharacterized protein LY79DRAFT_668871 [Colletotrichum navitas]KAK1593926.1 hypothetical protein LY79DRAFT_668871 [Colletotrichum navitas]